MTYLSDQSAGSPRQVARTCRRCSVVFHVAKSLGRAKFCSKLCYDLAQQTSERRRLNCARCASEFVAAKDHGKWPRFCSRICFEQRRYKRPEDRRKKCPACDGLFNAEVSGKHEDGLRAYCSKKCAADGLRRPNDRVCEACGCEFVVSDSRARNYPTRFCSQTCQASFMRRERATNWKGGAYVDEGSGQVRVLLPRPGFISPYIAEHRVIASRIIGRMLAPHEPIIHINRINDDNRPENLFICGSNSEMKRRFQGSLPFPSKSNLGTYK